jgi:hypothetical protein
LRTTIDEAIDIGLSMFLEHIEFVGEAHERYQNHNQIQARVEVVVFDNHEPYYMVIPVDWIGLSLRDRPTVVSILQLLLGTLLIHNILKKNTIKL